MALKMTQPNVEPQQAVSLKENETTNHLTNASKPTKPSKPTKVLKPSLKINPQTSKLTNCDILLNIFQIKKKRYRVLLNNDHIVWEAFEARRSAAGKENVEKITQKETEYESEQLSHKAAYGYLSNVVHINEIIRVNKGSTKSLANRVQLQPIAQTNHQQQSTVPIDGSNSKSSQIPSQAASLTPSNSLPFSSSPLEQYLCIHYAERINSSSTDCNRWKVRSLTLYNSDTNLVRHWYSILSKKLLLLQPQRIKRLMVFINPYGGRKQGLQMYENYCKNLFLLAGIDPSCIISQRANQIRDILMTHDLSQYDAVCCVGGDGTVAEVINGLLFRAMSDHRIDFEKPEYIPKPCLPVGIIPAGSTDTIAYSLHGTSDVRTAAIHLILGQRRGLDVSSVRNRNGIIRFCASVLSYGYLGDVAAKSEKYRWMGTKRYEYTGVKAFLMNRGYEAEISILQPEEEEEQATSSTNALNKNTPLTPPNSPDSLCLTNCQRCSLASTVTNRFSDNRYSFTDCYSDEDDNNLENFSKRLDPTRSSNVFKDLDEPDDKPISLNCDNNLISKQNVNSSENLNQFPQKETNSNTASSSTPPAILRNKMEENYLKLSLNSRSFDSNFSNSENNLDKSKFITIKGKFFMISGANITCACSRSPNGISRYCHLGDGYLDLILVRKTSLINNIKFLLNTVGRNGDIRNLPFVEVYRTRQFSFRTQYFSETENNSIRGSTQPITNVNNTDDLLDDRVSRWNCDGEVVSDLDITMISHCQLVDVFMRGPYAYEKPTQEPKRSFFCCCRRN